MTSDQISLLLQLQLRQTLALEKISDALERLKEGKFAIPNKNVDPVSKAYVPPYEIQIGARIKVINEKLFGESKEGIVTDVRRGGTSWLVQVNVEGMTRVVRPWDVEVQP
ncbi:hypothetical protein [Brasilonema bromeliae]|uniref:Uncharacterized protein n=1 Tax=Brasilonema bromeliae SPC951 TaxID=385972 RepID=A0ABX1P7Q4_9CYAN|nr:hypothetical protein [Brasilonema bromeliae]NMG20063.1 hypothetical protein [Brasilonema bromeliae SPC951]